MKPIFRILLVFIRLASLGLVLAAGWLAYTHYGKFTLERSVYPPGSMIAGIPMGGVDRQQALGRLIQAYSIPVELHYNNERILVQPDVLGFHLDLTTMLVEAEVQRTNRPVEAAFWDYLWDRNPAAPLQIPLQASVDENRIRTYLISEIARRYDQPAQVAMPVAGTLYFKPGKSGTTLNIAQAVPLISKALRSLSDRQVNLVTSPVKPAGPSLKNLQILLSQVITLSHFEGISEIYLQDMQSHQEMHFAFQNGKTLLPDIGFTAASTIKIPIMISTFRRVAEPVPPDVLAYLEKMIEISENDPADSLMKLLDKNNGPLEVTKDIQALGLKNTFLAGYFFPGAPLLKRFSTPANQRNDYYTDPDPYNQTTPAEMGRLLADIYQCAENGSGTFATIFPGQITQNECKQMIEFLVLNKLPVLITAGLPEGTKIAHKHGWIEELDGMVHSFSDAAIVFTPGGDYVLTVYLWKKDQLLFDTANALTSDLSQAVYNYFNIDQ